LITNGLTAVTLSPPIADLPPPRRGFFYVRDSTPSLRLVHGGTDLRQDDLFKIKKDELDAARKTNERKLDRLLDDHVRIERKLARVNQELLEDQRKLVEFDATLEKYHSGNGHCQKDIG
jgi:hypothetical protein